MEEKQQELSNFKVQISFKNCQNWLNDNKCFFDDVWNIVVNHCDARFQIVWNFVLFFLQPIRWNYKKQNVAIFKFQQIS